MKVNTLKLKAHVRYWEDSQFNGVEDDNKGSLAPCKINDLWCPVIDVSSGKITNWKLGTTAKIHYKVADGCGYELIDSDSNIILSRDDGYVCRTLNPVENEGGDYIIMNIDKNGFIEDWKFNIVDFNDGSSYL